MSDSADHYRTLQVDPEAEPEVIEAAYRRLCRKYHPDVNRDPDAERRIKAINAAYEVLSEPERRAAHDRQRNHQTRREPRREAPAGSARPAPGSEPTGRSGPRLALSQTRLELAGPGGAGFELFNLGEGQLTGAISTPSAWLRVTPATFTANRVFVSVAAVGEGYASGRDREGYVFVTTNGGTAAVTVRVLGANAAAQIEVTPRRLLIGSAPGGFRPSAMLHITNRGRLPLAGVIRSTGDWLRCSPVVFGGAAADIQISADFSRLSAGLDHYATLLIESNGGAATIPVQAFVCAAHVAAVV